MVIDSEDDMSQLEPSLGSEMAKVICHWGSQYNQLQNIKQKIQVLQPVDLQKKASNSSDIFRDCAGGRAGPIACCLPKKILTRPLVYFFMISRSGCGKKYTCEPPYIYKYLNII